MDSPKHQPTAANAPAASAQSQAAPISKAKPAKVWTNDEVDVLKNNSGVSVVGTNPPQNTNATFAKVKGYSLEKDPNWYRQQLRPLQAEIDKLDAQIAKLQAFLSGENVSDPPTMHHQMVPSPQDQLRQAEEKRAKDVEKVNELLDHARHNDIPPGALRYAETVGLCTLCFRSSDPSKTLAVGQFPVSP